MNSKSSKSVPNFSRFLSKGITPASYPIYQGDEFRTQPIPPPIAGEQESLIVANHDIQFPPDTSIEFFNGNVHTNLGSSNQFVCTSETGQLFKYIEILRLCGIEHLLIQIPREFYFPCLFVLLGILRKFACVAIDCQTRTFELVLSNQTNRELEIKNKLLTDEIRRLQNVHENYHAFVQAWDPVTAIDSSAGSDNKVATEEFRRLCEVHENYHAQMQVRDSVRTNCLQCCDSDNIDATAGSSCDRLCACSESGDKP
jgi:hypothetical protein